MMLLDQLCVVWLDVYTADASWLVGFCFKDHDVVLVYPVWVLQCGGLGGEFGDLFQIRQFKKCP